MINVYFEGSYGLRKIDTVNTQQEVYAVINKFLLEHNFKSYYTNMYIVSDSPLNQPAVKYDVGSWSEFFYSDDIGAWKNEMEGKM